jgi:hypothetical protein
MTFIASASTPMAARLRRRLHVGHGRTRPAEPQPRRSGLLAALLRLPKPRSHAVAADAGRSSLALYASPALPLAARMPVAGAKSS